jgi:hypothetical protein
VNRSIGFLGIAQSGQNLLQEFEPTFHVLRSETLQTFKVDSIMEQSNRFVKGSDRHCFAADYTTKEGTALLLMKFINDFSCLSWKIISTSSFQQSPHEQGLQIPATVGNHHVHFFALNLIADPVRLEKDLSVFFDTYF